MPSRRLAILALLAGSLAAAATTAQAQPAATSRIRGTITAFAGGELRVATREGPEVAIRVPDNARVAAVGRASLSDIKPGVYIGTAAMPRPDGSLMAIEVLLFPEAMRGVGEGHRSWDLRQESTMTNALVGEGVTRGVDGQMLTLSYKDGQKTLTVPPEAPIVTLIPADRSDLKPGAKLFASVTRDAAGLLTAASLTVGKDGVDPPM